MKYSITAIFIAGLCFACTPRAHLRNNTGLSLKRVLALQNSVRPQSKLAPLTAEDAKIIMSNHRAGHAKSGSRSRSQSGSGSRSAVGSREVDLASPPKASVRRRE
jgi:hypothetical protein